MKLLFFATCILLFCALWGPSTASVDYVFREMYWDISLAEAELTDGKGNLMVNDGQHLYVTSVDAGFFNKDIDEECYHCRYVYYNTEHYVSCQFKTRNYAKYNDPFREYEFRILMSERPELNIKWSYKPQCYDKINSFTDFTSVKIKSMTRYYNHIGEARYDEFDDLEYLPEPWRGKQTGKIIFFGPDCHFEQFFNKVSI
eukprot:jgi/Orpsp1_1/1174747/evm.model.c7180000051243.1